MAEKLNQAVETVAAAEPVCGIVMPISAIDGCEEFHWSEVRSIISEAVESAGFKANIVSNADDVGIIQKRIIQNLYDNPIVVCDVSGKNPNVMFELGMRLAFDRPTIIVKDDKTQYSFDTSPIEHIDYPRDLRFSKIVEFKKSLKTKVLATYEASRVDPSYTTFLKHFGEFKVAKIEEKEVSQQEFFGEQMSEMKSMIFSLSRDIRRGRGLETIGRRHSSNAVTDICLADSSPAELKMIFDRAGRHPGVESVELKDYRDHKHIICRKLSGWSQPIEEIRSEIRQEIRMVKGDT